MDELNKAKIAEAMRILRSEGFIVLDARPNNIMKIHEAIYKAMESKFWNAHRVIRAIEDAGFTKI